MGRKVLNAGFALTMTMLMIVGVSMPHGLSLLVFSIGTPMAFASPNKCPKEPDKEKMKEIPGCASKKPEAEQKLCEECNLEISHQKQQMQSIKQLKGVCEGLNAQCGGVVAAQGNRSGGNQNAGAQNPATGAFSEAQQCLRKKETMNRNAKEFAQDCEKALKKCSKFNEAKEMGKMCKDLAKDAQQNEAENKKAGDDAKNNGDKAKDNEKKGESAGQMPQMPQIPQQQGGNEQQPQQQADYPQATSPTPGSDDKEKQEIAESKFDEDKDKSAIPAVGFGNTTPVGTATVTSPGPSATAQGFDPSRNPSGSNGFGDKPLPGSVAATGLPQGGGGGGGLNSSGASLPGGGQGAGEGEKKPNEANPYEVPVGSGGRLGAPKGKTGGESDSALDSAATSAFKDDFKADPNAGVGNGADMASAGAEEDGYSIFKMVKYRYTELKKRGSI